MVLIYEEGVFRGELDSLNRRFKGCFEYNIYATTGTQTGAAGMCAFSPAGTVDLLHCENTGAITITNSNGPNVYTGGLLGRQYKAVVNVTYCKNTGAIQGTKGGNSYNPTGGIVSGPQYDDWMGTGFNYYISYCYNDGPVTGRQVGGIMGGIGTDGNNNPRLAITISHCINGANGAITGHEPGGIVGTPSANNHTNAGAISSSFCRPILTGSSTKQLLISFTICLLILHTWLF